MVVVGPRLLTTSRSARSRGKARQQKNEAENMGGGRREGVVMRQEMGRLILGWMETERQAGKLNVYSDEHEDLWGIKMNLVYYLN